MDADNKEHVETADSRDKEAAPIGYGKESVTVFALGLSGALVWGLGIIPSIMALVKARKAKRELLEAEGQLHGFGLIKAGIALAITGIVHFLLTIAMAFGLVWVVNQIPVWVEDAFSSGQIAGIEITEVLPPVNLNNLGLPEESLQQIEGLLPEGQSLDSVDIGDLLAQLEGSDGYQEIDPKLLAELGLEDLTFDEASLQQLLELMNSN